MRPKNKRPVNFRFFTQVLSANQCWLWKGAKNADGYGTIRVDGCSRGAHQVAYEMVYGPIAEGFSVLHSCDVRHCVNPLHLWQGTQADNVRDAVAKGRLVALSGERHGRAVFTWRKVREMRQLYASGMSQVAIAQRFNTRQGTIGNILRNEGWKEESIG